MEIDRKSRNRLAEAMRRYLNEKTTAFEFDEEIFTVADNTHDATVKHVAAALWYFYDDCDDHTVVLSKPAWDYFYRLILLLESEAHLEIESRWRWSCTQAIAAITLIAFVVWVARLGIGYHLIAITMPFGLVSVLLARLRRKTSADLTFYDEAVVHFSSVSEILAVRRRTKGFQKVRYPDGLKGKRIRSRLMENAIALNTYFLWAIFSPFVLLFQLFPVTDSRLRVVLH